MAAQTELPKIESMQRFNEEKCLSSILLMYRFLMCMIIVFDVHFHVFPQPHFILICVWRGRYKHQEMKYLRQKWDFILESGRNYLCIRYVFEEPKTCIFDYSFPPNITDKINYSFANVYFTSKTSMTQALMLEKLFLQ